MRRIRRGNTPQSTGLELVIERATVDTGERRDFFGRVARHLITHETRSNAGWSGSGEIDGWYVDSEFLPREKRGTVVALLIAGDARPRVRVNQTGPAPAGLAVKESQISHYTLPMARGKLTKERSK